MKVHLAVRAATTPLSVITGADLFQRHVDGLADRVLTLRTARGLSQEELAARAFLHPRHLQKLEAAAGNVTLMTLTRAATGLGVDITELLKLGRARRVR